MAEKRTDERLYGGGTGRVQYEHSPYTSYRSSPGSTNVVAVKPESMASQRLFGVIADEASQTVPYEAMGLVGIAGIPPAERAEGIIKVLVVDDHHIVREGICALVGLQKDMQVVGEAVDGEEALQKVRQLSPDIVLMDIMMPRMSGLEAAKRIGAEGAHTKVLMLTQYDEDENVLASREAGARGFVAKKSAGPDLLDGIRSVNLGKAFFTPSDASFAYV
jgi:CheY-like chemotaxis protein